MNNYVLWHNYSFYNSSMWYHVGNDKFEPRLLTIYLMSPCKGIFNLANIQQYIS